MGKEGNTKRKNYILPSLFTLAVALVFVSLFVSITVQKDNTPSVKNGSSTTEIEEYAYSLLETEEDTASALGYNEAIAYYDTQIAAAAANAEQQFNLQLDFAIFYGNTGDPSAGLQVLDTIDAYQIPLDARYYLYTTYIFLYNRLGDEEVVAEYRQRIVDEGIIEYIAGLDNGTITPETNTGETTEDDEEEAEAEAEI